MNEPLDYESQQESARYSISPLPTFVAYAIVYVVVGGVMFFAVPNFEQIFKDFKTELPGSTKLMLLFARWFREIGWLVLMPVPIIVPFALNKLAPPRLEPRPNRHWRIAGITSIALLAIGVLMLISIWMPVMTLFTTVSSPPKP